MQTNVDKKQSKIETFESKYERLKGGEQPKAQFDKVWCADLLCILDLVAEETGILYFHDLGKEIMEKRPVSETTRLIEIVVESQNALIQARTGNDTEMAATQLYEVLISTFSAFYKRPEGLKLYNNNMQDIQEVLDILEP